MTTWYADEYVRLLTDRIMLTQVQEASGVPSSRWYDSVENKVRHCLGDLGGGGSGGVSEDGLKAQDRGVLLGNFAIWVMNQKTCDPLAPDKTAEDVLWRGVKLVLNIGGNFHPGMNSYVSAFILSGSQWSNIDEWGCWVPLRAESGCKYFSILHGEIPYTPRYSGSVGSVNMVA